MGALHQGHLTLVRLAQRRADRVIVSIFVNPAQFAPHEDFKTYPRTFAADVKALAALGTDLVWAPDAATMYPGGFATQVVPEGPAKAGLEDAFPAALLCRRGDGGRKTSHPMRARLRRVRREGLSAAQGGHAACARPRSCRPASCPRRRCAKRTGSRSLRATATSPQPNAKQRRRFTACWPIAPKRSPRANRSVRFYGKARRIIERAGFILDYLEARHAETLAPVNSNKDGPIRLLVAAKIGKTRLIDNVEV